MKLFLSFFICLLFVVSSQIMGNIEYDKKLIDNKNKTPLFSKIIGDFDPQKEEGFFPVPFTGKLKTLNKKKIYLEYQTLVALQRVASAFQEAFPRESFIILSGTRNFSYQEFIWERKWQKLKDKGLTDAQKRDDILLYSSIPGTSRHHWGTDVDIFYLNSEDFKTPKGAKIYRWMRKKLPQYGFFQCFSKGREIGYKTEEWHWSYLPLAKKYLRAYESLLTQNPQKVISKIRKLEGFKEEQIDNKSLLKMMRDYIWGISPKCL